MMLRSKFLRKCLTGLLIFSLITGGALAANPKQIFSDVRKGHWAESVITRMSLKGIVKGYADGSYGVNRSVSRLETITMIIRTMGLENEAKDKKIPSTFKNPDAVSEWGKGYVAMGVIKGVISGNDLDSFRGNDYAKRYEVARFMGNAMGLESVASEHISDPLSYTDAADIPSDVRGYVALLKSKGIMTGNADGSFKPMQNLTRAELAVLIARLDEHLNKLPEKEIRGIVSQVKENSISLTSEDGTQMLTVSGDTYIFIDGKEAALKDITPGFKVMVIHEGLKALLVEAQNEGLSRLEGTIKEISQEGSNLVLNTSSGAVNLTISPDAVIKIDGSMSKIKNLEKGQKAQIQASGNIALIVEAENETTTFSGTVVSLSFYPDVTLTVKDKNGEELTYNINPGCVVKRNGSRVSIQAVITGDTVKLQLVNGQVALLDAESVDGEAEGTVKQIVVGNEITITISDVDGKERTFLVNDDTRIRRNDDPISLLDIKPGDYVELRLSSNVVTRMYVESKNTKEQITGEVISIDTGLNLLVIESKENEKRERYTVITDSNTNIVLADGRISSKLSNVKEGDRIVVVGKSQGYIINGTTILVLSTN
ncbi:MAG: S-layer homology domain-containing protein [Bacillota bacterium]|jgi:hypothetical protein